RAFSLSPSIAGDTPRCQHSSRCHRMPGGVMKAVFSLRIVYVLISLSFVAFPLSAPAQDWKPERPVEMVIGCAPGCGPDNMARLMQRVFQVNRYFDQPLNIQNKAGGSGVAARTYLNQFEGNGHYLYHADGRGLLIARAMGRGMQTDVTPVAVLFGEYIGIAVKADSPLTWGRY